MQKSIKVRAVVQDNKIAYFRDGTVYVGDIDKTFGDGFYTVIYTMTNDHTIIMQLTKVSE